MQHGFITILTHQAKRQPTAATDTNLTSAETNYQISNEGIFCFSRAMTHHHTPAIGLGKLAARREKQIKPHTIPVCLAAFALALMPSGRHSLLWQDRTAPWYILGLRDNTVTKSCFYTCLDPVKLFDMPIGLQDQRYRFTRRYHLLVNNFLPHRWPSNRFLFH